MEWITEFLGSCTIVAKPKKYKRFVPLRDLTISSHTQQLLESETNMSTTTCNFTNILAGPVGSIQYLLATASSNTCPSSQSSNDGSVIIKCAKCTETELAYILKDNGQPNSFTIVVPKAGATNMQSCTGMSIQIFDLVMISEIIGIAAGCNVL